MRRRTGAGPVAGPMRAWRRRHGITQERAARLLRTSRTNWARWETSAVQPDPRWRGRILALLAGAPAAMTPKTLTAWRGRHALYQREVADLLGVKQSTISRWEAGVMGPGRHEGTLWRLMDRMDSQARLVVEEAQGGAER